MPDEKDKGPRLRKIFPHDNRERLICPECDHVAYENPQIINVVVATWQDQVLLVRRAIAPRTGFWNLPGGFMENGETVQEGAAREAREEAGADIAVGDLIAIYHAVNNTKVMLVFRGALQSPRIDPGPESLEAKLFSWEDIPWNELAFPSDKCALERFDALRNDSIVQPDIRVLSRPAAPPSPPPPSP